MQRYVFVIHPRQGKEVAGNPEGLFKIRKDIVETIQGHGGELLDIGFIPRLEDTAGIPVDEKHDATYRMICGHFKIKAETHWTLFRALDRLEGVQMISTGPEGEKDHDDKKCLLG